MKLARSNTVRFLVWSGVVVCAIVGLVLVQRAERDEMKLAHPDLVRRRMMQQGAVTTSNAWEMFTVMSNDTTTPKVFFQPPGLMRAP